MILPAPAIGALDTFLLGVRTYPCGFGFEIVQAASVSMWTRAQDGGGLGPELIDCPAQVAQREL